MESLDDVIDDLIADRVIRRHRRVWLIVIAVVVAAALVVLLTGGWKERVGRSVPTLEATAEAPATVAAGRWEFSFGKAEIVREPKTEYSAAKAELRVYFDVRNIDTEEHQSASPSPKVLRLVPGGGQDLVESGGVNCHGEFGWVIVYGLPPESCFTTFKIEPDFSADQIEVGILGEQYISDNGLMGANEDPYWQSPIATAVVRLKPAVVVKDEEK